MNKNSFRRFLARNVIFLRGNKIKASQTFPYRRDTRVDRFMDAALLKKTTWNKQKTNYSPDMFIETEIGKIWSKIPGRNKWLNYFPIYERVFQDLRNKSLNVLEIGVFKGSSLQMWKEYFGRKSKIVGIDIDVSCKRFEDVKNDVHVRIGSQDDQMFLTQVVADLGPFDVIIDDGSHCASHQIASFNSLFLQGLNECGIYLIEDIHTAFWSDTNHRDLPISIVDYAKQLIDYQNYHYIQHSYEDFVLKNKKIRATLSVPLVTTFLSEIRFFDSIIVLHKKKRLPPATQSF